MSKNQVQVGRTLSFQSVPAGGVESGDVIIIGAAVGVCQTDADAGSVVEADVEGCFSLPKTAGQTVAFGAKLYVVTATGVVSTTASGNVALGYASRAAAANDASVEVKLVPLA